MERITHNGKELWRKSQKRKQPRTRTGTDTSFTTRLKRGLVKTAFVCALGWLVYGGYSLGAFDQNRTVYASNATTTAIIIDSQGKSIRELQDDALTKLSYGCEVKDVPAAKQEGKITFDSNSLASTGLFQFQQDTVVGYIKLRDKKDITYAEANIIASTKEKAWELARYIAFEDGAHGGKGIGNWFNCSNREFLIGKEKVQLRDYVAFIIQLSRI